jgi:hypothetical protein
VNNSRSNTVLVGLLFAIIAPRVEKATGVKLSLEDFLDLLTIGLAAWHGVLSVIERYFPPPNPTSPQSGAKALQ